MQSLYLGRNNPQEQGAEPESICTEKLFELCTLNLNQDCVPVMMKADCVLGFISECILQVDGSWDSIRSTLSHFWFSSAKEDIEKKVAQVGVHEILCGWMPVSCQERLWGVVGFFSVLKQKATIGFMSVFSYFMQCYREKWGQTLTPQK